MPDDQTNGWFFFREKVLPSVAATALLAVAAAGFAMWSQLQVIAVKLDQQVDQQKTRDFLQDKQIDDHESRVRRLEDRRTS